MTVKGRVSPQSAPVQQPRGARSTTPFKRGRSKVFYASDDKCLPKYPITQTASVILKESYEEFNENDTLDTEPLLWRSTLDVCKETSEGSSSGDEALSPSGCSIRSPAGSLRSSLGGSLRGSQDSGYSDSGESNSGGAPELDRVESPPRVKHISRVFFGGGTDRASLYSDTIVTTPLVSPPVSGKLNENINNITKLTLRQKSCSTQVESRDSYSGSSRSSPTSICDSDEPQCQLENKSILDTSSSSYDEQTSRKTGAIRKSSYIGGHRRGPRRSTSADKLLDEPKHRKPCILKARRRWSTVDPKVLNLNPENSQSETFYHGVERFQSLGTVHETSFRNGQVEHGQINTPSSKTSIKRLRIHPTALATEMK